MKPSEFVILTRSGSLGVGVFPAIKWHKQEKENILNELGITCEYGEEIHYSEDKGTFKTLGDMDHAGLIKDYIENTYGGMVKIAEAMRISSGTVSNHIREHNMAIHSKGACEMCQRVGSDYNQFEARRIGII